MSRPEFDFTSHLDRRGTHSAKWDLLAAPLGTDAYSLSIADMEFRTCPEVVAAVVAAAKHGTYGYTEVFDDFAHAASAWQSRRHAWELDPTDVHFFPRVVNCVSVLVNDIIPHQTKSPAKVCTLDPAYSPLLEVCDRAGATIERVEILDSAGEARIDFAALKEAMSRADILLWTNPHNPTGRVWTRKELERVADLARTYGTLIFSDDIHADFERPGRCRYTPIAVVAPDLWESGRIIQCASPGKTFSIAGLEATAICVHGTLGEALEIAKRRAGLHNPNYFAIPAALAAWTKGDAWVDALIMRVDANLRAARALLAERLPRATISDPDGTYLLWIDARDYLKGSADLKDVSTRSRVAVSDGSEFGAGFSGWFRINVALPESELLDALSRLLDEFPPLLTDSTADVSTR